MTTLGKYGCFQCVGFEECLDDDDVDDNECLEMATMYVHPLSFRHLPLHFIGGL